MNDLTGQTLGQYRIIEPIGRGGMASVYKAYQPSLDRYVAIKVLPPYYAHEPGFAARFTREAKAVAKLDHPHILPIYDFGQEGELSFIVMKYVAAGTLKDMLGQPMPLAQVAEIIGQLAAALDHAHEQGVIHRDVKPSNVLMDRSQWALLMDFGLAKIVASSVQLTASGVGMGTPAYMAPEQGQGGDVDHRADVYSLGIVLYEMLTGQVPFDAETPLAVVLKHVTDPLPMPRTVNPAIPKAVERVVLKALAKGPDDRYATAGEMATALQRALIEAETPPEIALPLTEVAPPLPKEPTVPGVVEVEEAVEVLPRRKLPWWAFVVSAAALLMLGGGILLTTGIVPGTRRRTPVPTQSLPAVEQPTDQYTIVFQQEVSPDPSYAGTTDVILARGEVKPNINLGGAEHLETFFDNNVESRRSLMRWDLSALPPDVTVNAASLELYRYGGEAENAMEIALYRVTHDWTEGTGSDFWAGSSYVPDGATWPTADGDVAWTTPGGDHDTTTDYGHGANGIVDQITLPVEMGEGWVRLDATAAVRDWIEEGVPNYGLLLRPQSGDYTYHYYYSRNCGAPNLRPRLVVTYTGGAAPPSTGEIIVDNTDPDFTIEAGDWGTCENGHCGGTCYGANFRYARPGCTSCQARFDFNVVTAGEYDVWTWWPQGEDRATDTSFTVTYSGSPFTVNVDQRNNGDAWYWLGTLTFEAGESASIVVAGTDTGYANADAIALTPAGSGPPTMGTPR